MGSLANSPKLKRWGPRIASCILLALAFPPFNFGLLVFAALVPWMATLKGQSGKEAWKNGYGFGFLFALTQLHWIGSLTAKWTGSLALAIIPTVLASLAMAVYYGLLGVLIQRCYARNWPWAIPLVWAGVEVFRSYIPGLAFPWNLLAMPLWMYLPINQAAYFGSIWLISAWVVLTNQLVAAALDKADWRTLRPQLIAWAGVLSLSLIRYVTPLDTQTKVVTLGQIGIDLADPNRNDEIPRINQAMTEFMLNSARNGSELLILPEGIGGKFPKMPPTLAVPVFSELPIMVGGQLGTDHLYQTVFSYDGEWDFAKKSRLVIFGEYVPFRTVFPFLQDAFRLPAGDMEPSGEPPKMLRSKGTRVGPVICFEAIFPDIAWRQAMNGSQMLAQLSIDDWYITTPAADQLRASTVWRSIETGLATARTASLGYTMAVDGKGHVIAEAPLREKKLLRVELPIAKGTSGFRFYPVFPICAFLFAAGMLFAPVFRLRKTEAKSV